MSDGGRILPGYRGHIDRVEPAVSGWVVEIARPATPVALVLGIDGEGRFRAIADRPRPDVAAAGLGGPNCGFHIGLPPDALDGAEHDIALLLPDGSSLNLPGSPMRVALGPLRAELIAADAADAGPVLDLLRRTDAEAGFDPRLVTPENAAAFNALRCPEQGFLFYARAGGRLVGYGRLERGIGDEDAFGVVALTVVAAYRRKGLGERLLLCLLQAARQAELREVWLSVRPDNAPAIRLYEKTGFVSRPNHPAGRWPAPGEMTMVWLPR